MKPFLIPIALASMCIFASCATMQTHKNVRLMNSYYSGVELSRPSKVYHANGQWFIQAQSVKLSKRYPLVNDPIFLETEEPTLSKIPGESLPVFLPISAGTAKILRDPQGYASLPVLKTELNRLSNAPAQHALPNAQAFPVLAQFEAQSTPTYLSAPSPNHEPSLANRVLAGLDLVFVDAPGTLIYNIAIPVMAPFYFFKNLRIDQKKDPFN